MKTPKQAAQYLTVSVKTLAQWRWLGSGPPFVKVSARCIRYQTAALDTFVADRIRASTADQGSTP